MIKLLVMDVDGTLTDGKIVIGNNGEEFKSFNVKDGLGIKQLIQKNIIPVIITGRKSNIVDIRAKELSIEYVYQGVLDKKQMLCKIANNLNINLSEIAYIGDDVNDLDCILICGLTGCPKNSSLKVLSNVDVVCNNNGGEGCVREFIEYILELNEKEK